MKKLTLTLFLALICSIGFAQKSDSFKIDSLQKQLRSATNDTLKANLIFEIINHFSINNLNDLNNGQFAKVYEAYRNAFDVYENPEYQTLFNRLGKNNKYYESFWSFLTNHTFNYGILMGVTANKEEQLIYFKKAYQLAKERNDSFNLAITQINIAFTFQQKNKLDSAQFYVDRIFANPLPQWNFYFYLFYLAGDIRLEAGSHELAKRLFLKGIENTLKNNIYTETGLAINYLGLSKAYQHINKRDSSYYYGIKSIDLLKVIKEVQIVKVDLASAYDNMFEHFQRFAQPDSSFKYLKLAYTERAVFTKKTISNLAAFQQVLLKKQLTLKDLQREKIETQGRMRMYILLTALLVFVGLGAVLSYNYLQKKKANVILASQKEEIQSTLSQLKSTQAQLIQSEKLASLGELTAGIAHEIQNPLNFVNNFSEVSSELVDEMNQELEKGDIIEAKEIANDLKQNLEKINLHGKRASSIVKGMLEHSRASTGVKELTDINKLADEYLRLSYHRLRAKDKDFNADYELIIDENLPKIEVIPQDIGRVLLNLINNAFYAVNERSKAPQPPKGEQEVSALSRLNDDSYVPTVIVSTHYLAPPLGVGGLIEICVKDNGIGMPESVRAKVFQPFFTTKPTGQGTGLGLSLAYDIVTKGHGGTLEVVSTEGTSRDNREGVGSEFIITLPFKTN